MNRQKHLFNEMLRRYRKYLSKLNRLRESNRNEHRQRVLQKHISRLHDKLSCLNRSIRLASAGALTVGLLFLSATEVHAQNFPNYELDPFNLKGSDLPDIQFNAGDKFGTPAFADFDADCDQDLLVGTADGNIFYYQNTGSATAAFFATPTTSLLNTASFADRVHVSIADFDKDGDFDVIAGSYDDNNIY